MQLTDWLLVEVALLLIGLTKISFAKDSTYTVGVCFVSLLSSMLE
jgi:hypothetical protein